MHILAYLFSFSSKEALPILLTICSTGKSRGGVSSRVLIHPLVEGTETMLVLSPVESSVSDMGGPSMVKERLRRSFSVKKDRAGSEELNSFPCLLRDWSPPETSLIPWNTLSAKISST